MTWPQLAPPAPSTLVVPLGSTEQHGPHLPFETDTIIAEAWAGRVARSMSDTVAAPALAYGSSGEHQGFPGTLSIGRSALRLLVVELARSAARSFGRLVLLSGHAGNAGPLGAAVEQLRREGHDVVHRVPSWSSAPGGPLDAHAGRIETSLLLHLRPDLVRLDRVEAGRTEPLAELMDRLVSDGVASVSANGVLGDPAGASADEGRHLLDDLVDRTVHDLLSGR